MLRKWAPQDNILFKYFLFLPQLKWKDFVNESNECLPIRQRALYDIWYAFSNRIACRVKISAMVLENYIYDDGWSETYMYDWGYIYYWELAAHHREKREYEAGGKEWSGMVWKQNRRLRGLETGDWTPISGLKGDYWCVSTLDSVQQPNGISKAHSAPLCYSSLYCLYSSLYWSVMYLCF